MIPVEIQYEQKDLVINKYMVLKLLQNLKTDKSPGPDRLNPRLLYEIKETIAEPLSIIFNQSLALKTVRKEWKNAQISAIFKKGNKSQARNYRPVSLTSVVCKIMEKLIRLHIINHMKANKLFSNKQYGFIEGRSTALQLLEVIDNWSEALDEGLDIDCICTDFQKAFDKVPHKRLIKTIENYGIANPILSWIEDFLSRRYQRVSIEGEISNRMEDTSGIPQGSALGPILFVFYINDLPDVVESEVYLFADDTNIFRLINSIDDQQILQNDLIKLENWSDKCLLKFHPEKCKHMNMHRTPKEEEVKYNLLGQEISKVKDE
jgi:hypothetical protein